MQIRSFSKGKYSKEVGQGLVEYALVLILFGIVIYVLFLGGRWAYDRFFGDEPDAQQSPVTSPIIDEAEIEKFTELGSIGEVLDEETTTTNNCNSSTPTEIETQRVRVVEHAVVIEGKGGVSFGEAEIASIPVLQFLKISLEGKYGVQDKQTEERSYTIRFVTGANRWATHTVIWKYTWQTGEATIKFPDGSEEVYSYQVRTALEPETISEEKNCD